MFAAVSAQMRSQIACFEPILFPLIAARLPTPPKKQSKWESETVVLMKGIRTPLAAVFLRVISWDESPCENFVECGGSYFLKVNQVKLGCWL